MLVPEKLYGLIGYPLGHSLSPILHNWSCSRMAWPGAYFAWPVPPDRLAEMIRALRLLSVHGVSVTIPHKEAVLPLLDSVRPLAASAGAVNTLYWEGSRLCGENTDILGFLAPWGHKNLSLPRRALVLGAGGAARAVLTALHEINVPHIYISGRDGRKVESVARAFQAVSVPWAERHLRGADCVINTTPLGMAGIHQDVSPFPAEGFMGVGLAYDLVYHPLETRFLREAAAAGWRTQDGLDMLVAQGLAQFHLWTGLTPPPDEARALLLETLRPQA